MARRVQRGPSLSSSESRDENCDRGGLTLEDLKPPPPIQSIKSVHSKFKLPVAYITCKGEVTAFEMKNTFFTFGNDPSCDYVVGKAKLIAKLVIGNRNRPESADLRIYRSKVTIDGKVTNVSNVTDLRMNHGSSFVIAGKEFTFLVDDVGMGIAARTLTEERERLQEEILEAQLRWAEN